MRFKFLVNIKLGIDFVTKRVYSEYVFVLNNIGSRRQG